MRRYRLWVEVLVEDDESLDALVGDIAAAASEPEKHSRWWWRADSAVEAEWLGDTED